MQINGELTPTEVKRVLARYIRSSTGVPLDMSGNEIKLFLKHRNPASKSWDWHEVRDWEVRLEFSHTTPPNTHSVLTDADGEEID